MGRTKKITAFTLAAALTVTGLSFAPVTAKADDLLDSYASGVFEGHTYALFTNEMNWKAAKAYCEEVGGHLVTITSAEENQYLTDTFVAPLGSGVSIGFTDEEVEGEFVWVTGEAADYTNWEEGEPNNENDENYAMIQSSGEWNDGHLDEEDWPFICEWDTEIVFVEVQTLYRNQTMDVPTDYLADPTCTSTDSAVVSTSGGQIKGVKAGKAAVLATDGGESGLLMITVKNPTLNKKSVTLKVNKKFKLAVTGKVGTPKFKSTNAKIASVNAKGVITAKKKGTATIQVKTNGITLKCKVKVK